MKPMMINIPNPNRFDMLHKLLKGICLCFLFLAFANDTNAQRYENMSPEVQGQMDLNKINGKESMDGILVDYEFTIAGVTDAKTAGEFESLLRKACGLVAFKYNASNGHVSFTLPAKYNSKNMKSVFEGTPYGFNLFFKESYHL